MANNYDDNTINKAKIIRTLKQLQDKGDIVTISNKNVRKKIFYTDIEIGDRLRDIRKANKFTQAELGEILGITRSAINSWEAGLTMPSTQYLILLSKIYNVTTDYLLGLNNDEYISISHLKQSDKEIIYQLLKRLSK